MRKLLLGLLLMSALFCAALANTVYLNMELSAIKSDIPNSLISDQDEMISLLEKAYSRYKSSKAYMDTVLRESKCDSIVQLFTEALNSPFESVPKLMLINVLEGISESEKLSFGSIF